MDWIRSNAPRLVLAGAGLTVFVVGFVRDSDPLIVLGVLVLVLAVFFDRLLSFRLGPKGLDATLQRVEQKIDRTDIRNALANYIAEGDQVVNALSMAHQMVVADLRDRRQPEYDMTVWDREASWLHDVRSYISRTEGLGEAEAVLFESQVPELQSHIKLPERFEDSIGFVRAKQNRIRDLMRKFD